ncbi:MAG: cytochrome c [Gammaproteobacteria bacterium]|nr:cytochrome c [Gammaproteobacteria bacterium]
MDIQKKTVSITNLGVAAAALLLSISSVHAGSTGEAMYLQHCSMCHQPDGKGIPGFFPPLADNPRVISEKPEKVQEYLSRIIFGYHGGLIVNKQMYSGNMPPIGYVGRINDSELLELINYQRTAFGNNARPVTFSELARARKTGSP